VVGSQDLAVVGSPGAVVGSQAAVVGSPGAVVGNQGAVVGNQDLAVAVEGTQTVALCREPEQPVVQARDRLPAVLLLRQGWRFQRVRRGAPLAVRARRLGCKGLPRAPGQIRSGTRSD
jgi:hypothetical protein